MWGIVGKKQEPLALLEVCVPSGYQNTLKKALTSQVMSIVIPILVAAKIKTKVVICKFILIIWSKCLLGTIQSLYNSSDMSLLSQWNSVLLFQRTFNAQSWYESFYTGIIICENLIINCDLY